MNVVILSRWIYLSLATKWYFYATAPEKRRTYWRYIRGNRSLACFGEANPDWENTLEKRPEQ